MGKLVVTEYLTLDGVFEEPGQWSFPFWSDEAGRFKREELFASDAQLLGRLTYEGFAQAWPTMEGTGDFGERMNAMPKFVVSTTIDQGDWNNTTVIGSNLVDEVTSLKSRFDGDILVAGSGQLVQTLADHNLVDEYRFMVHPLVLGTGKRLFNEGAGKVVMKLTDTKTFSSGVVVLFYEPAPNQE